MNVTNKIRVEIQIDNFKFPAHSTTEDVPEKIQRHQRFRQLVGRGTLVIEKTKRKKKVEEKAEEKADETPDNGEESKSWFRG